MTYRGPEILDFRDSWLREIAAYQEQIKSLQFNENNTKTPMGSHFGTPKNKSMGQIRNNKLVSVEQEKVHEKTTQYIVNTYHAKLLKKENKTRSSSIAFKESIPLTQAIVREVPSKQKRVMSTGRAGTKSIANGMRGMNGKSPKKRSKLKGDLIDTKINGWLHNLSIIHHDAKFQPTDIQDDQIHETIETKAITTPHHTKLAAAQASTLMTTSRTIIPEAHSIFENIHRKLNGVKADQSVEVQIEKLQEVLGKTFKTPSKTNIRETIPYHPPLTSNSTRPSDVLNINLFSHVNNGSSLEKKDIGDSTLDNDLYDMIDDQSLSSIDTEVEYKGHTYLTDDDDNGEEESSLSASSTIKESYLNNISEIKKYYSPQSVLQPSLFPLVPPYLTFSSHAEQGPAMPSDLQRVLKWRLTTVTPKIVRYVVTNTGMRVLKKTHDWMGTWDKHMKSVGFKELQPYQKYNHLPGSFKIGRKDSVWKNLQEKLNRFGKKEFGFMRRTYILPEETQQLKRSWPKYAQQNTKWILKPPASARGVGVRLISKWSEIPQGEEPTLIQKYIEKPLLINGSKFDLRLYVLITSMDPLRIFIYNEGLARFASVQYSDKIESIHDRCMHLTNYSINKYSTNYVKNDDIDACCGHKWSLKALWSHLEEQNINTKQIWGKIRNLVVRTMLVGESGINRMMRHSLSSKYCAYELFGFDVLLDENLTPWLLEVNISPSLHIELPLDQHVKGPLVQAILNTACYQVPPKLTKQQQKEILIQFNLSSPLCFDWRLYTTSLSNEETSKHKRFTDKSMERREDYLDAILENLTPDDIRCLIIAEDELARSAPLERIFPGSHSYTFLHYSETPRYYNRLLDAWEAKYSSRRDDGIKYLKKICGKGIHLSVIASAISIPEFRAGSDEDDGNVD